MITVATPIHAEIMLRIMLDDFNIEKTKLIVIVCEMQSLRIVV